MNKRKTLRHKMLAIMAVFFFAVTMAAIPTPAHALLVLGSYIFIGPDSSSDTYKIKNMDSAPQAYRIEWMQLQQMAKGPKQKLPADAVIPNVMNAEPHMYVAPRRLMLQGKQMQHIRFMVRRTENMAPGEYRSYIYLEPEAIPKAYKPGSDPALPDGRPGASATLGILTGYRIPVIFLHGETSLKAGVANPRIMPYSGGKQALHFTFTREGNRSAIGELILNCLTPQGEIKVADGGIKVFTELNAKDFIYDFHVPAEGCNQLAVDFLPHKKDPDYTGVPQRLAVVPWS